MKNSYYNILNFLFNLIFLNASPYLSLILINLRFKLSKKSNSVKFKYSPNNKMFYLNMDGFNFFILEKSRFYLYGQGLNKRIAQLSRQYLIHKINFKENDVVIDCGANIGEFYLCLPQKINYFAFEPSLPEFKCLKKNITSLNSNLFNTGLWNKNTNLKFYLNHESADSSFVKPAKFMNIKKIDVKRFDNLFPKNLKIKLFKLEAEGCELEVLEGCGSILNNIKYITADLGFERGEMQESTYQPVKDYLTKKFDFKEVARTNDRLIILFENKKFH